MKLKALGDHPDLEKAEAGLSPTLHSSVEASKAGISNEVLQSCDAFAAYISECVIKRIAPVAYTLQLKAIRFPYTLGSSTHQMKLTRGYFVQSRSDFFVSVSATHLWLLEYWFCVRCSLNGVAHFRRRFSRPRRAAYFATPVPVVIPRPSLA